MMINKMNKMIQIKINNIISKMFKIKLINNCNIK